MQHSAPKRLQHRLEWLLISGLFALFQRLPLETASDFGGWLARRVGPHLKVNRVARRNLSQAFPEWSGDKVDAVTRDMWDNLGRYATEFPHIAKLTPEQFAAITEIEGAEHLLAAKHFGTGTLIFSGHMANWEMGVKTGTELGIPLSAVYRPLNNPHMDALVNHYRNQYQTHGIAKTASGGRELLKTLRDNGHVAFLLDQKMNSGIPISFFGRDAMTATSIADLHLKHGYPILPARIERIGKKPRFKVTIFPPLEYDKTGDTKADVKAIMQATHRLLEDWIRERPEQWFWVHKRWG